MLSSNYSSNDLIPNCTTNNYNAASSIAYKTNIYYSKNLTTLTIVTNSASYDVTLPSAYSTAMAISPDGSKLFVGTSYTDNSHLSYSIVTLNDGLPPTPITDIQITNNVASISPTLTNSVSFLGNAVYRSVSNPTPNDLWYAADTDNNIIWVINSTSNTANIFAQAPLSPNLGLNGVTSDNINMYIASYATNSPIYYCPVTDTTGNTLSTIAVAGSSISNAADITYVPSPTSLFYFPDLANNNINYGTINTTTLIYTSSGTYQISPTLSPATIGFSDQGGTGTLRFYTIVENNSSGENDLYKLYLTNGGSATSGDPHVKTIFGDSYTLNNNIKYFKLFDNVVDDRIIINCKCWFLGEQEIEEYKQKHQIIPDYMLNYTFMRYIAILYNNERLIIDFETLDEVEYTNDIDVENNELPKIETQERFGKIELSKIYENEDGILSITHKKYVKSGKTLSRNITIKSSDCIVKLILSVDKYNPDRNSVEIKINGTRELNSENYKGTNISKGCENEWEIKSLIDY
jgi:hypothetical protein